MGALGSALKGKSALGNAAGPAARFRSRVAHAHGAGGHQGVVVGDAGAHAGDQPRMRLDAFGAAREPCILGFHASHEALAELLEPLIATRLVAADAAAIGGARNHANANTHAGVLPRQATRAARRRQSEQARHSPSTPSV